MTYCVYVTERIVSSYEFDTEEEARNAMDNGDFWHMESELIDGEVLDVELVEQKGYWLMGMSVISVVVTTLCKAHIRGICNMFVWLPCYNVRPHCRVTECLTSKGPL